MKPGLISTTALTLTRKNLYKIWREMNEELTLLTALVRQRAEEQSDLNRELVGAIERIQSRLIALESEDRRNGDPR
jgi:hypothetical protein